MKAKFFKKVIAVGLAVSSLFAMMSTTTVLAKENKGSLTVVGSDYIPNNTMRFYSDLSAPTSGFFDVVEMESRKETSINFSDCYDKPIDLVLSASEKYQLRWGMRWRNNGTGTMDTKRSYSYENTGGLYKKVKVRLCDVDTNYYFLNDGTHVSTIFDDTYCYNFTDEGNGYVSLLVIDSGGAVTRTHPDEDGNVEFYVHCKIGSVPEWHTTYATKSNASSAGSFDKLYKLTKGNVDLDNNVSISDVTELQRYLAGIKDLSDISKFNADVDNNDTVSIFDATEIQKYLAGY